MKTYKVSLLCEIEASSENEAYHLFIELLNDWNLEYDVEVTEVEDES